MADGRRPVPGRAWSEAEPSRYAPSLRARRDRPAPRPSRRSHPGWLWILAGALLLVGVLSMVYRRHPDAVSREVAPTPRVSPASAPAAPLAAPPEGDRQATGVAPPAAMAPRASLLQVTRRSPTSQTFNYPDTPIEVTFNHPVNPMTVSQGFRVTPSREGTLEFPAPDRLVFRPQQLWDRGATYLVTLDEGITDESGLDHLDRTSWEFAIVGGYFYSRDIRPLVGAYCAACHRSGGTAARIPLDELSNIRRFVEPGKAEQSRILTVLADPNHNGKVAAQALAKLYVLRDWIGLFQAGD